MSTNAFDDARRSAVYDVIRERRDIRSTFTMDPIDDAALTRVLAAAHMAPSVGFSQPWDFVLVRDEERRRRIQRLAQRPQPGEQDDEGERLGEVVVRTEVEALIVAPTDITPSGSATGSPRACRASGNGCSTGSRSRPSARPRSTSSSPATPRAAARTPSDATPTPG